MSDSRERKLANGMSFVARTCPGLFPSCGLIETAKGTNGHDEHSDTEGGDKKVAAYPTRLQPVGIADFLATA